MMIVLAVIILLVLTIFLIYEVTKSIKTKESLRENFRDDAPPIVESEYVADMYERSGAERCDVLFADLGERANMRIKSLETMDNYILGLRLREWKPMPKHPKFASGSNYCYMYYDSNNNVMDSALYNKKCDATNLLFNRAPFVTGIFTDDTRDTTHKLPYQKCIVEINPKLTTTSNLDVFWDSVGEQQCQSLYASSQKAMTSLKSTYSTCNLELDTFRKREPEYDYLTKQNQELNDHLKFLNHNIYTSNCGFFGINSRQNKYSKKCEDYQQGSLNNYTNVLNSLKDIDALINVTTKEVNDRLAATLKYKSALERQIADLVAKLGQVEKEFEKCNAIDLPNKQEAVSQLTTDIESLKQQINTLASDYDKCKTTRKPLPPRQAALDNKNIEIAGEIEKKDTQLIECRVQYNQLKQSINTLRDEVRKYQVQRNECDHAHETLKARLGRLRQEQEQLKGERDYWLERCRGDQSSWYQVISNTVRTRAQEGVDNSRLVCGDSAKEADEVYSLNRQKMDLAMKIEEERNKDPFTQKQCLEDMEDGKSKYFDNLIRDCCKT